MTFGTGALDLGRQARVAVVEADHVEAALGEQLAQLAVPVDELHPEAHHEEERLVRRVADRLVDELDLADLCALLRHRPGRLDPQSVQEPHREAEVARSEVVRVASEQLELRDVAPLEPPAVAEQLEQDLASLVVAQPVDAARDERLPAAVHVPEPRGDEPAASGVRMSRLHDRHAEHRERPAEAPLHDGRAPTRSAFTRCAGARAADRIDRPAVCGVARARSDPLERRRRRRKVRGWSRSQFSARMAPARGAPRGHFWGNASTLPCRGGAVLPLQVEVEEPDRLAGISPLGPVVVRAARVPEVAELERDARARRGLEGPVDAQRLGSGEEVVGPAVLHQERGAWPGQPHPAVEARSARGPPRARSGAPARRGPRAPSRS